MVELWIDLPLSPFPGKNRIEEEIKKGKRKRNISLCFDARNLVAW
jgi:hypothetical protein